MAACGYDETLVPLPIQGFSTRTSGYEELLSAIPVHPAHVCVPLPRPHMQIRLLELHPVSWPDPNTAPSLHGRLRVISLQEHRQYSALSYVWRQEDPGTSERENRLVIHCDRHQHEARITPNCWSALWHLNKARGGLTIWVDSVCIDQKNDEEKAQQIPLMRAIYESAETTYFWLGEAGKGTDEAFNYLSTNVLSVSKGTVYNMIWAAFALFVRRHTLQVHPHWSALHNIFKRPWIERLWTLQEAVLSGNSTVVCGEMSIPWADFICALRSIHFFRTQTFMLFFEDSYMLWLNLANLSRWFAESDAGRSRRQHPLGQTSDRLHGLDQKVRRQLRCLKWARCMYFGLCFVFIALLGWFLLSVIPETKLPWLTGLGIPLVMCIYISLLNASAILTARKLGLSRNFNLRSHSIVQELRTRKVTNQKDMYFGTLGILSDDSFVTEGTLSDLYTRLCISLIGRTESLDVLLFANADRKKKCPSWVIDWGSETPHIWEKILEWIPTSEPNPASCGQQDSTLMHSEFCIHLHKFYKSSALNKWFWARWSFRFFLLVDLSSGRRLRRYQGATPGSRPLSGFRNQGEHLCVYGLVLNRIFCHFAPMPTRSSTTEPQPAPRVLTADREFVHIDLVDSSNTSVTSETAARHGEVCMFTSLVYGALSDMTENQRMKAVDRVNKLIDILTKSRNSARLLWMWWRRLLLNTANNQGPGWIEDLLAEDNSLKVRLDAFMESLGAEGLSVVRCQRTELRTGGLAFGPATVQEGDSVALVSGVSYPLVLRPCGEQHFKLIGPIFLPEAMDGELAGLLTTESVREIILV